ncbi:MAG: LexA family protein [Cyanobacteriota bacterium]
MPVLHELCDLPLAQPIPCRGSTNPDGVDLNLLLMANPLTTFFMRVRGQHLRAWGVREGDLLLIDRAIEPRPGHLVVVAHGGRFLLRPLVGQADHQWRLAGLGPTDPPIPWNQQDPLASGLFGVATHAVHHLLRPRERSVGPPKVLRG